MKKIILFLIMLVFLSTNLYAEELHYHKDMYCLNPDGTPLGEMERDRDAIIIDEDYKKISLQDAFKEQAGYAGIPTQIPSKNIEYNSEKIAGVVTIEPVSSTQVFILESQDGGDTATLMTYNPATKTTRITTCYEVP